MCCPVIWIGALLGLLGLGGLGGIGGIGGIGGSASSLINHYINFFLGLFGGATV